MKAFCEKYITYLIAILMIVLIYKMFTYEEKLDAIKSDTGYLHDMVQKTEPLPE